MFYQPLPGIETITLSGTKISGENNLFLELSDLRPGTELAKKLEKEEYIKDTGKWLQIYLKKVATTDEISKELEKLFLLTKK